MALGILGSLLLWATFPPVNLPVLAWIAPVAWLRLVLQPQLSGWRPYVALWLCGFAHWLLMLEGIRLAHPALYAGWIALAAYLGVYLPAFIGLTRVAVHRLKISIVVAAPIVWVGLELLRGHLITGFSMGLLAHTQAEFPWLIQISDLAGGYTLSFVIMLVAACLAAMLSGCSREHFSIRWWPVLPATAAIAFMLLYGQWRLNQKPPGLDGPSAGVALIQGSLDTVFDVSPDRLRETLEHYRALTVQAVEKHASLDLVAWPESMFVVSETIIDSPIDSQSTIEELDGDLQARQGIFKAVLAAEAARANANTAADQPRTLLLVGTTTVVYGGGEPRFYNAALLADGTGNVINRYYKTHPVMFGEYIPFGAALPWLYKLTPMAGGLSTGDGAKVFDVAGLKMSPSICFESTIPHLIRGQLAELHRRGAPADVLVNVTNDGWFWGTGMLDLHFRCGVFRAVENHKPLLVVANTGISTFVDGSGVVRERGERRRPQVLVARVQADGRVSPYQTLGDWPALLCAAACFGLAAIGFLNRESS
jgi:apolipoprotein N-acyltransferase